MVPPIDDELTESVSLSKGLGNVSYNKNSVESQGSNPFGTINGKGLGDISLNKDSIGSQGSNPFGTINGKVGSADIKSKELPTADDKLGDLTSPEKVKAANQSDPCEDS